MWRKPEDARDTKETKDVKPVSTVTEAPAPPAASRPEPAVRTVAGLTAEVVQPSGGTITSSLLIKGEITGREDLYIDGEVQGAIRVTDGRVTVGPHAKITADVDAREIVVRGKVKGALRARERVEVGSTGEVNGDIATRRIAIGEGAHIRSKVEIASSDDQRTSRTTAKSSGSPAAVPQAVAAKSGSEIAN